MTTPTHTNELYAIALEILDDAEPDLFGLWYFSNGLRDRLAFIMQKLKEGTTMNKRKIVTHYVPPPIPNRGFDWTAIEDGYDEGGLIGYGATEAEAIKDLESQLQEG